MGKMLDKKKRLSSSYAVDIFLSNHIAECKNDVIVRYLDTENQSKVELYEEIGGIVCSGTISL